MWSTIRNHANKSILPILVSVVGCGQVDMDQPPHQTKSVAEGVVLGNVTKPWIVSQGIVKKGSSFLSVVKIYNLSEKQYEIQGFSSSCECTRIEGIPIGVPPGEVREVKIVTDFSGEPNFVGNLNIVMNLSSNDTIVGWIEVKCEVD